MKKLGNLKNKKPILLIVYKRFESTKKVIEAIASYKPTRIYIASNGANPKNLEELNEINKVRSLINLIDWDCEVRTLFREEHLFVKYSIPSAIDWFFSCEQDGIILEDDCVPSLSFFRFCDELLDRYRDNPRISMISGNNFQFGYASSKESYYYSEITHIWGWATWKNRWENDYDVEMMDWPKMKKEVHLKRWFGSKTMRTYFFKTFNKAFLGKINTWDYQWNYASLKNNRLSVMPNKNLVSNIGIDLISEHKINTSPLAMMKADEIEFPLKHPVEIIAARMMDERYFQNFINIPIYKRAANKILRMLCTR